jgi:hypothetical protein
MDRFVADFLRAQRRMHSTPPWLYLAGRNAPKDKSSIDSIDYSIFSGSTRSVVFGQIEFSRKWATECSMNARTFAANNVREP